MAQVAYDYPVMFAGDIFRVTQTWNGNDPVVASVPPNDRLCQRLREMLVQHGEVEYKMRDSYYEVAGLS